MANPDHIEVEHTCYSCDGLVSPDQITCPCGVFLKEMGDPFAGLSFEERMNTEFMLEQEERHGHRP